mmetsp:Transcript_9815/g.12154  ORF Transcript_9815/g.12154 Transcript_9815/m.12154 type:complete len:125 (-) Transcript_9815:1992-2366(-)
MIMEALLEGGWSNQEDESKDKSTEDGADSSENSLVASILKGNDEQQMVQSALNSQSEEGKDGAVQKLVDTLDQDLGLDGDDGDESKKKVTSVGLKQNIRNANKKESGDDDEVNTGEPAASEDVK